MLSTSTQSEGICYCLKKWKGRPHLDKAFETIEAAERHLKFQEHTPGTQLHIYSTDKGRDYREKDREREAVEHFLTALNLQNQADTPTGTKSQMFEGIWSTLRLAILYLGKHDLLRLVDSKSLDMLIKI